MTILPMILAATGIGVGHAILPDHWMPLALLARTRRYPLRRTARLALAAAVTHVVVSVLFGLAVAAVGLRFRETVARHTGVAVGGVLVVTAVALVALEVLGRGHRHAHADGGCGHADTHEPAAADRELSARVVRQSGHGVAVLERPAAESPRRRMTLARIGAAARSAPDRGHGSLLTLPGAASRSMPRPDRSLLPVPEGPGAASRTMPRPDRSLLPVPEAAANPAPDPHRRRNLLTVLAPFGAAASPDLTILPLFLTAGALGVGPALGVLVAFALATVAVIVGLTMAAATGASRLTAPWIEERATLLTAATLLLIGALVISGVL